MSSTYMFCVLKYYGLIKRICIVTSLYNCFILKTNESLVLICSILKLENYVLFVKLCQFSLGYFLETHMFVFKAEFIRFGFRLPSTEL